MSSNQRRSFLKKLSLAGASLGLVLPTALATDKGAAKKNSFTFLHLTDMHVRRKRQGHKGYQACIDAVNKKEAAADFVLMGGDLAFDGNYTAKEEFVDQLSLYKQISDQLKMPYYNSIGNHDVLGWNARRKVATDDPDLGKVLVMQMLNMEKSYYSFDHKGWHFVVMDSIYPTQEAHGPSYKAKFGAEQLEWLRFDLGQHSGKPTVIMTHIAAFCHIGQLNGDRDYKAIGHMVVEDTREFRHIIERHGVKAVLQGHSHVPEGFCFNGVWYITSQSVSAAWWGGNWKGYKPGYTLFRAEANALSWERKTFEWEHQLEPEDELERKKIAEWSAFEAQQAGLALEEKAGAAAKTKQ
ncbi:metallophosphoesterase [Cesiribacter sp. SM1]|uniref:metallophosphoesterase family protein n=1 Tax=Cesiribacter sp. SM1 TaxID=2861196 RepID=UPI001CD3D216|nr:metallophosphoesterase [Cesiribacter sp. SM1]